MIFNKKFSTFVGNFYPPGSGSGFRIRIRIWIHWTDWIRIQSGSGYGSGSATLLWSVTSDMLLLMCYLWSATPLWFVTSDIFQLWPVSSVSWPFTYYCHLLFFFFSDLLPLLLLSLIFYLLSVTYYPFPLSRYLWPWFELPLACLLWLLLLIRYFLSVTSNVFPLNCFLWSVTSDLVTFYLLSIIVTSNMLPLRLWYCSSYRTLFFCCVTSNIFSFVCYLLYVACDLYCNLWYLIAIQGASKKLCTVLT